MLRAIPREFAESARNIVLMEIVESLAQGAPLVALTGPAGAGKTIMAAALDLELRGRAVQVMRVRRGEAGDVGLRTLSSQLLGKPEADFTVNDVEALHEVMLPSEAPTQRPVIIIDDAELLRDDALECLRLLSGATTRRMPQIVFIGDSTLWDRADRAAEADLRSEVAQRWELAPLDSEPAPARELAAEPVPVAAASPSPIAAGRRSRWPLATACAATVAGVIGAVCLGTQSEMGHQRGTLASVDTCSGGGRVSCRIPGDAGCARGARAGHCDRAARGRR